MLKLMATNGDKGSFNMASRKTVRSPKRPPSQVGTQPLQTRKIPKVSKSSKGDTPGKY